MTSTKPQLAGLLGWLDTHLSYERITGALSLRTDQEKQESLIRVAAYLEAIGSPHLAYPTVHLTGTNGKTTTTRMITALMLSQGLTTGTYTSPHLERLNERIAINGEPITDDDFAEALHALQLVEPTIENVGACSYFELMTMTSFRAFADAALDVGVIEVGLGGTWDATNVIQPEVAVVTNVELDHQDYLGPTRVDIANAKSGIVKPGCTLVLGETDPQLFPIFKERGAKELFLADRDFATESNRVAVGGRVVSLRTPRARYEDVFISLHGAHQGINAATALTAAESFFGEPLSEEVVRDAFGSVSSPGRMEVMHRRPLVIIDGAHNVAGADALLAAVDEEFGEMDRVLVVGMLAPHEPDEILRALQASKARMVIACQPDFPRAVPAGEVGEVAKALGVPTAVVPKVADAVQEGMAVAGEDGLVLVSGSLYVVGEARSSLSAGRPAARQGIKAVAESPY